MAIAPYIRKYFWEINPKTSQPKKHPTYYIQRILELGDTKAFSWIKKVFGKEKVKEVAKNANLTPRSKNYWLHKL